MCIMCIYWLKRWHPLGRLRTHFLFLSFPLCFVPIAVVLNALFAYRISIFIFSMCENVPYVFALPIYHLIFSGFQRRIIHRMTLLWDGEFREVGFLLTLKRVKGLELIASFAFIERWQWRRRCNPIFWKTLRALSRITFAFRISARTIEKKNENKNKNQTESEKNAIHSHEKQYSDWSVRVCD